IIPLYEVRATVAANNRQLLKSSAIATIAGCMVTDGKVKRNGKVRIDRDGNVITSDAKIQSLRHEKDDVNEISAGYECGMVLSYPDIQVGDPIQAYGEGEYTRN